MYKVFFNERIAFLREEDPRFQVREGDLIHRFAGKRELREVLERFAEEEPIRNLYLVDDDPVRLAEAFRNCFKLFEAGGGLVFNKEGDFLVIRRWGKWDLPKGKLKKREDFEAAALREVREETGLEELSIVQPLITTWHTYRLGEKRILKKTRWFEMYYGGEGDPLPQSEEGITGYRWVRPGSAGFIFRETYGSIIDVLKVKGLHDSNLAPGSHDAEQLLFKPFGRKGGGGKEQVAVWPDQVGGGESLHKIIGEDPRLTLIKQGFPTIPVALHKILHLGLLLCHHHSQNLQVFSMPRQV